MNWIVIDFETFYSKEYSLRQMTPYEYILDPRFECIGASVMMGNEEPMFLEEAELKYMFSRLDPHTTALISHNALFDMCIVTMRFGFNPALMVDTIGMARALIAGKIKSYSLKAVGEYLGLQDKGTVLQQVIGMNGAAIKRAGLWDDYEQYANGDAVICRGIFDALITDFPAEELVVNDMIIRMAALPQFKLDQFKLAAHLAAVQSEKAQLMAMVEGMGADKGSLMSNEKFADLLRQRGVEPPTKTSPTTGQSVYAFAKTDEAMDELKDHWDPGVQALVSARLKHKSTLEETRTQRLLNISRLTLPSKGDGWAPIPLKYSGAHTHRFSGDWKINMQNLPGRKSMTMREALIAPPGYTVLSCDASQIEARLTAWLCGQDDLVDQFAQGADVYSNFASEIYNYPCNKREHPVERFLGKTSILGLGFNMGPPKFSNTVRTQAAEQNVNIDMNLEIAQTVVSLYRRKYSNITAAWKELHLFLPSMATGTLDVMFGPCRIKGNKIILPNGLVIEYHDLRNEDGRWVYTWQRGTRDIYGGKMLENIVQALDRVIIMQAALRIRQRLPQLHVAHQVHDELIYVVPDELLPRARCIIYQELKAKPTWGETLPLDAETKEGPSYGALHDTTKDAKKELDTL